MLKLAARNLLRNLRRTLITLAAIAFGLGMMMVMINMQTGQYEEMVTKAVSQMAGHVVIQNPGYQEERDPELVVEGAAEIGATLAEAFPDATIAPRIVLGGLLVSSSSSVGGGLQGVTPSSEAAVGELDDRLVAGSWLDDEPGQGIVIGRGMADSLAVEVGDKLVYMGQHGGNEVVSKLFRVAGIFRTGAAEMDGFLAVTHLANAQELMERTDVAHQVTLHLTDPDRADAATARARELLSRDGLAILHWKEALPELYALIQVDRSSGDVMLAILGVIVAMGVLNTVLMSVLERTREFGVMLAIGMRPGHIARVVLLEGVVLGVAGSALGVLAGSLLSWPIVEYGIDYSTMLGGETFETAGIAISSVMKGAWNPWRMGVYAVAAVLFTVLAALYPAWHVTRLRPVEAIRHV